MKKEDPHVFKGMQRDMSISKQGAEFLWDANNIRLTAREGDTMLSITNERGTKKVEDIGFEGNYVGHCLINNRLIVFTAGEERAEETTDPDTEKPEYTTSRTKDHIYMVEYNDDKFSQTTLYEGNLKLSVKYPLETEGVYELDTVQKVYWTDGINPPRMINIMKDPSYYNDDSFNFVRELKLKEEVRVFRETDSTGQFPSGVLQYAFTYFDKYGQETNIFHTTQLINICHSDRGGNPEEKIGSSFRIEVSNWDTNFEYMRIYSLVRTSIDAVPVCKRVADIRLLPETPDAPSHAVSSKPFDERVSGIISNTDKEVVTDTTDNVKVLTDDNLGWTGLDDIYDDQYGEVGSNGGRYWHFSKAEFPNLILAAWSLRMKFSVYITWGTATDIYIPREPEDTEYGSGYVIYSAGGLMKCGSKYHSEDVPELSTTAVVYKDNNTTGDDVDPQSLLYLGGESITAGTFSTKDNVMFLGNLSVSRPYITEKQKADIRKNVSIETSTRTAYVKNNIESSGKGYTWGNQLSAKTGSPTGDSSDVSQLPLSNTAAFMTGEHYRLGVQFQYKTGKWSDPVYLGDVIQDKKPEINYQTLTLPSFRAYLPYSVAKVLTASGYKKVRGLVVLPDDSDRLVIAQGVLNPTLMNVPQGADHIPDRQPSWFFRPYPTEEDEEYDTENLNLGTGSSTKGYPVQFKHGYSLYGHYHTGSEIQGVPPELSDIYFGFDVDDLIKDRTVTRTFEETEDIPYTRLQNIFVVDRNIVTMHSPDIEFGSTVINKDLDGVKCQRIGYETLHSTAGDIDIQTSSPVISDTGSGFAHMPTLASKGYSSSGRSDLRLCNGMFYRDYPVDDTRSDGARFFAWKHGDPGVGGGAYNEFSFMVYPWHKTGSLNNDIVRPTDGGARSSVLKEKKISNLLFFSNAVIDESFEYRNGDKEGIIESNVNSMVIYNSDQPIIVKAGGKNYLGNVDKLLVPPIEYGALFSAGISTKRVETQVTDPVTGRVETVVSYVTDTVPTNYHTSPDDDIIYNRLWDMTKFAVIRLQHGDVSNLKYWWNTSENKHSVGETFDFDSYKATYKSDWGFDEWEGIGDNTGLLRVQKEAIRMRYKSTPHAILKLDGDITDVDKNHRANESIKDYPVLALAKLCRDADKSLDFGGTSAQALQENLWIPAGDAVSIGDGVEIQWIWGDSWYQRYDCLKTYAYTNDDVNSVIEIGSFMLQTRINIDGRYDRNRGQLSNLYMSPQNFNLINMVYSQRNNFFNYRIKDEAYYNQTEYPVTISWSLEKSAGSDVDPWTQITLASTLDADGTKGAVTAIRRTNNNIYCFQERGFSQILFNPRVQIPVSDGVPVEISNSGKVEGLRYITNSTGCIGGSATAETAGGIYFIGNPDSSLYLWNESQLTNISTQLGFSHWFKEQDSYSPWQPHYTSFSDASDNIVVPQKGIRLIYDELHHDLYVVTDSKALCFSETLKLFSSFFDYGRMYGIASFKHHACIINNSRAEDDNNEYPRKLYLWKMGEGTGLTGAGEELPVYCNFFDVDSQADLTFVSNAESGKDKIFTNIETRMEGTYKDGDTLHTSFFDTLHVCNEYQDTGETELRNRRLYPSFSRKFRIWRMDIPRDRRHRMDRIRNTWCKIKLTMNKNDHFMPYEIHDMIVIYYS